MARVRNLQYQGGIVEQPLYDGVPLTKWIHNGIVVWENGNDGVLVAFHVRYSNAYHIYFYNWDIRTNELTLVTLPFGKTYSNPINDYNASMYSSDVGAFPNSIPFINYIHHSIFEGGDERNAYLVYADGTYIDFPTERVQITGAFDTSYVTMTDGKRCFWASSKIEYIISFTSSGSTSICNIVRLSIDPNVQSTVMARYSCNINDLLGITTAHMVNTWFGNGVERPFGYLDESVIMRTPWCVYFGNRDTNSDMYYFYYLRVDGTLVEFYSMPFARYPSTYDTCHSMVIGSTLLCTFTSYANMYNEVTHKYYYAYRNKLFMISSNGTVRYLSNDYTSNDRNNIYRHYENPYFVYDAINELYYIYSDDFENSGKLMYTCVNKNCELIRIRRNISKQVTIDGKTYTIPIPASGYSRESLYRMYDAHGNFGLFNNQIKGLLFSIDPGGTHKEGNTLIYLDNYELEVNSNTVCLNNPIIED